MDKSVGVKIGVKTRKGGCGGLVGGNANTSRKKIQQKKQGNIKKRNNILQQPCPSNGLQRVCKTKPAYRFRCN